MRFVMSSRNSLSRAALIGLTLGVVALSGCGQGEQAASQAQAQTQAPAPEVTVVTMKASPITLTRELPGRTTASLVAEVRPQVSGIIRERLFTEGSFVDRKSTRLNSSHVKISYAVFCLKKKKVSN